MSIGKRVKLRREELGMTQEELANKIGYKSKSSINKIELDVQNLRQSKIKQIADALDTTTDYIMGWDTQSENTREDVEMLISLAKKSDPDSVGLCIRLLSYLLKRKEMIDNGKSN